MYICDNGGGCQFCESETKGENSIFGNGFKKRIYGYTPSVDLLHNWKAFCDFLLKEK